MSTNSDDEMAGKQRDNRDRAAGQPQLTPLPKCLTYAALLDVHDREIEITELMVQQACKEMEQYEQFPFAPKNKS